MVRSILGVTNIWCVFYTNLYGSPAVLSQGSICPCDVVAADTLLMLLNVNV